MKSCALPVCVLFVLFTRTQGQCENTAGHPIITSCEESYKTGTNVFAEFHKIKHTCTCSVMPFFTGMLMVQVKWNVSHLLCNSKVKVNSTTVFNCAVASPQSSTFTVEANKTAVVFTVEDTSATSGVIYPCILLKDNGGTEESLTVKCGNSTTESPSITTLTWKPETAVTLPTVMTEKSSSEDINTEKTHTHTATQSTTAVVYSSQQQATSVDIDNIIHIITGAAVGGVVVIVVVVLIVIIILRKGKKRNNDKSQKTGGVSEHTNRAFNENGGLPDNPLYHSNFAEPVDEVGYSTVQKEQLGLPPKDEANKKKKDPDYDVPPNNKRINDPDASSMPIYAVPNKSATNSPKDNQVQGMYAQVSKPRKGSPQVPMQSANQDGLMYLEVVNNSAIVNQNTPYTKNENKDGVTYAEIKRN